VAAFPVGDVEVLNGNYTGYHDWVQAKLRSGSSVRNVSSLQTEDKVESEPITTKSPLSKNQIDRIQKRIGEIEVLIPKLESRIGALGAELSSPAISTKFERSAELTQQISSIQSQVEDLYSEWDTLAEQL